MRSKLLILLRTLPVLSKHGKSLNYVSGGTPDWSFPGFDGIKAGALIVCNDAFSSREPEATSLENALMLPSAAAK